MNAAAAQNLFEKNLIRTAPESRIDCSPGILPAQCHGAARRRLPGAPVAPKISFQVKPLSFQSNGEMPVVYDKNRRAQLDFVSQQNGGGGFFYARGGRRFPNKAMSDLKLKITMKISAKTESGVVDELSLSAQIDSRITYPSYKSLDEFIDVERLRSLDGYITRRIKRRLDTQKDLKFYTGPYRLETGAPARPGSRMIYLSASIKPDSYFDLDKTALWQPSPCAEEFALLMDFIATLPFQATGRMLILYDDAARSVPAHRDHIKTDVCHEFIWFRTNLKKPLYMLNQSTTEKKYVEGYSAWFDSVNQYHGSDPYDGLSYSIRVDGKFTDEFRAKIPVPEINMASTPSYWASF